MNLAFAASLLVLAANLTGHETGTTDALAVVRAEAAGLRVEGAGNALVVSEVATEKVLKRVPVSAADGSQPSRVTTVRFAPERRSFVVGFAALPEVWELSIDPNAPDLYQGLVHDFRLGEGVPERGYLGVRRTRLDGPLPRFVLDRSGAYLLGCRADSPEPGCTLAMVHLDVRRRIAQFSLPSAPDLARTRDLSIERQPWLELLDLAGVARWRIDLARDRLHTLDDSTP